MRSPSTIRLGVGHMEMEILSVGWKLDMRNVEFQSGDLSNADHALIWNPCVFLDQKRNSIQYPQGAIRNARCGRNLELLSVPGARSCRENFQQVPTTSSRVYPGLVLFERLHFGLFVFVLSGHRKAVAPACQEDSRHP